MSPVRTAAQKDLHQRRSIHFYSEAWNVIDEKMVDKRINELHHQLAGKDSIFAWIQAWKTYANTSFTTNFG